MKRERTESNPRGAGRRLKGDAPRVTMTLRVADETKAKSRALRESGINVSELFDKFVKTL